MRYELYYSDGGANELPSIKKGIRVGSASDGKVFAFIEDPIHGRRAFRC
jgi:hypothetical protein